MNELAKNNHIFFWNELQIHVEMLWSVNNTFLEQDFFGDFFLFGKNR